MLFAFTDLLTDEKANETAAEFVRNKIRKIVKDKKLLNYFVPIIIDWNKKTMFR